MARLRRRHLWRKLLSASALVGLVAAGVHLAGREERYVPGQATEGVVDTLARSAPAGAAGLSFSDQTQSAGIAFRHFPARRSNRLPEDMGSGVALGDADGDGWCDLFLVNQAHALGGSAPADGSGRCALYRNRGDGSFEDVSAASGIDFEGLGMAAAFLDADSDGDLDLMLSAYGELRLYRNEGGLRFTDVSVPAGLAGREGFWTGLAVGDVDSDGALDVYVCGYVLFVEPSRQEGPAQYDIDIPASINPSAFAPQRNLLLCGRGDGSFEERAAQAGVDNPGGRSLSAVMADLDGDGLIDIYVANDVSDNALFVNRGDGTFADLTAPALVGDYRGAMGLSVGDFDRDRKPDFFVTHWVAQENALYNNQTPEATVEGGRPRPLFMDVADRYGLGQSALDRVGWATRLVDLDNDGWLDLFVVNGSTIPQSSDPLRLTPMRSQLYRNLGERRGFIEVGASACDLFREPHVGRGGATFDYDLDGDEDLLVTLHGEQPRLLRNDTPDQGAALRLRLRQPQGNRFALGARVRVDVGGVVLIDQLETQGSYLSQHTVGEVGFGLGAAAQVERVEVTWPDGTREQAGPWPAGSLVTWTRGEAPRVEALPGRQKTDAEGPAAADDRREFYRRLSTATRLRLDGRFDEARAAYEQALELWPAHEDALYYSGHCLLEEGDLSGAAAAFEALVRANPASSRGWMQIGECALLQPEAGPAQLARARAAFERAHAINGEESQPLVKLGVVAFLEGELDAADEWLADAVRTNPAAVEALWLRGRIAWLRGEAGRAQELLDAAHQAVQRAPAGASADAFDEGQTLSGRAMLSPAAQARQGELHRWRTLRQRPAEASREYDDLPR